MSISDDLIIIADSFNLELLVPANPVPTRYSNIVGESNSVINLMFLQNGSTELNNYSIHPEWHLSSDYAPLSVYILIVEESMYLFKLSILKNNEEETTFVKEVMNIIKNLNTSNLMSFSEIEDVVNFFTSSVEQAWKKNAK